MMVTSRGIIIRQAVDFSSIEVSNRGTRQRLDEDDAIAAVALVPLMPLMRKSQNRKQGKQGRV